MERMKKVLISVFSILLVMLLILSCWTPSSFVQKEPAKGVYHRVKKGETFRNIARAYHVKLQDLAEANNINSPGLIEEGSVIFIPDANQIIDDVIASVKIMDAQAKTAAAANNAASVKHAPVESNGKDEKTVAELPKNMDKKASPADASEKAKYARLTPREEDVTAEPAPARKQSFERSERKPKAKSAAEEKEEIQFEKRRFIWPVQGSVKTHFGIQPNKTYHNWIKIVSTTGNPVKAAASGIVIFSSQLKDYGETIIVRHEDSFATVYTHLKKRYVKTDQNVKKGDIIALTGEMDETGEAYMNFEVRLRGKARNPLFFLP
jgi:lipoprotein NlpD